MSTNKQLIKKWEDRLKSEGLGLIEDGNTIPSQIFTPRVYFAQEQIKYQPAEISERDAFIIKLYNRGKSATYIHRELLRSFPDEVIKKRRILYIIEKAKEFSRAECVRRGEVEQQAIEATDV